MYRNKKCNNDADDDMLMMDQLEANKSHTRHAYENPHSEGGTDTDYDDDDNNVALDDSESESENESDSDYVCDSDAEQGQENDDDFTMLMMKFTTTKARKEIRGYLVSKGIQPKQHYSSSTQWQDIPHIQDFFDHLRSRVCYHLMWL